MVNQGSIKCTYSLSSGWILCVYNTQKPRVGYLCILFSYVLHNTQSLLHESQSLWKEAQVHIIVDVNMLQKIKGI